MNTIEQQLALLKPTTQPALARRILRIPHRRRQRRRDCLVGFAGLLTGIVATVLVMIHLPVEKIEVPGVQYVVVNHQPCEVSVIPAQAGIQTNDVRHVLLDSDFRRNDGRLDSGFRRNDNLGWLESRSDIVADPLDLDAWFARYEKLLRHRREVASQTVVTPLILQDGVSPLEYRNKLLEELGG
jgi:hypothetical protein